MCYKYLIFNDLFGNVENYSYICETFVNNDYSYYGIAYEHRQKHYIFIYKEFSPFCKGSGWTH